MFGGVVLSLLLATVTAQLNIKKIWGSGFDCQLDVPITSNKNGWTGVLRFSHPTDKLDIWTASVVSTNADKSEYTLKNVDWNGQLSAGTKLALGFVIHFPERPYDTGSNRPFDADVPTFTFSDGSGSVPVQPTNPSSNTGNQGNNNQGNNNPDVIPTPGSKYNYDEAIRLSNLFYEAQRSGRLPGDNMVPWRGDSSVDDKGENGEDLSGGWHDAGDHVKFGFPMASSATMLLAGLYFFEEGYKAAGQYDMTLREVRWPLEYFIKCHVSNSRFYGQVGKGDVDHAWWGRPEDMRMWRPAYWVGDGSGGADILGETAAAMAAGAVVFKNTDKQFSDNLLAHAKDLYQMALKNRDVYTKKITDAQSYYGSDEWRDEVANAAAWLALATNDQSYTAAAKQYLNQLPGLPWSMDWADKRPLVRVLMYHMTKEAQFKSDTESFLKEWRPGGSIKKTPKGLAWRIKWGALRHAGNAAFIALLAAKEGIEVNNNVAFGESQINYMLGDAGRSYLIGFGHNYPQRPHHKAASCPWPKDDPVCDWNDYNSPNPNPHVLNGALVGGPGEHDEYSDQRSDYVTNEVTTDYNAGFQGALAGLKYFKTKSQSVIG